MELSEQYAFTTPSPDEDKDIWVVPLEIVTQIEVKRDYYFRTAGYLIDDLEERKRSLASARAIMEKFVGKVDRGMAKSVETYAEMTEWLEERDG